MTDALRWRKIPDEMPETGAAVVATDGHQRWFDRYDEVAVFGRHWMGSFLMGRRSEPTHWHPTLDLPPLEKVI